MIEYKVTSAEDLQKNPIKMIGQDWMLIAAEKDGKMNAMTASWGGIGFMWNKPVAFVVIRQTRYTKEFVDAGERFALNVFDGDCKQEMGHIGKVSGRDEDKLAVTGMKAEMAEGVPAFEKATKVLVCKKLFAQKFDEQSFIDKSILDRWYASDTMHTLYIAEIEKVLEK